MPTLVVESGLFRNAGDWTTVASPDVNNPVSPFFRASPSPCGMLVTNGLDRPWCGALVKNKRTIPVLNGVMLRFVCFHLLVRFPSITAANLARFETDLKACTKSRPDANTKIPNVANWSTQWNRDTKHWQIDPRGKWEDIEHAFTEDLTPDVCHLYELRGSMDLAALTWSVLSIRWDEEIYTVPSHQQNCPFLVTNWEQSANLQLQNEGYNAGSVEVQYDEGILAWSDQPIAEIPV